MIIKNIENFSLRQIDESGQCFRMQRMTLPAAYKYLQDKAPSQVPDCYRIIAKNRLLIAIQMDSKVYFDCSKEEYDEFWHEYFDLERDYNNYIKLINPNDKYLLTAAKAGSGVRILRQDLWEMIVTFLISQQNNIKRIRKCVENICTAYGKLCKNGEMTYYAFPEAEALAELDEEDLKSCNLGYRSKYVVRTAKMLTEGTLDLDAIKDMSYKEAKAELFKCFGVGEKVADCICLFALHHLQAFPVDTHIRQVLEQHYKKGFPNRRYKDCRGVMQQYIFYYELKAQAGS